MGAASRVTISTRYSIDGLAAQLRALYASLEARGRGHDVARA
jgi:hypothetical protein